MVRRKARCLTSPLSTHREKILTTQPRPTLVVYKEIVDGDMRKLLAESNDSKTGGGARDLRFPVRAFDSVLRQIFSKDAIGRGGQSIRIGDVIYLDSSSQPQKTQLEYWPPTNSRKTESRISKIHNSPALGGQLPRTGSGRVFVLLIQFSDGSVRCDYAYEEDLRANVWAPELSSVVLGCFASASAKNTTRTAGLVSAQGYYDFSTGTGYCHAD